jgi:hypothetical protein
MCSFSSKKSAKRAILDPFTGAVCVSRALVVVQPVCQPRRSGMAATCRENRYLPDPRAPGLAYSPWCCQPFSAFARGLTPKYAEHLGSFPAAVPHFLQRPSRLFPRGSCRKADFVCARFQRLCCGTAIAIEDSSQSSRMNARSFRKSRSNRCQQSQAVPQSSQFRAFPQESMCAGKHNVELCGTNENTRARSTN